MDIKIIHVNRSGKIVPTSQILNLSRQSPDTLLKALGNNFTHLPLNKTNAKIQVDTVHQAVVCYEKDLKDRVHQGSKQKVLALRHLYNRCLEIHKQNKTIYFECYCMDELNPKKYDHECHCQPLRRIILTKYNKNLVPEPQEPVATVPYTPRLPLLGLNGLLTDETT